jgi:hypothetical protein
LAQWLADEYILGFGSLISCSQGPTDPKKIITKFNIKIWMGRIARLTDHGGHCAKPLPLAAIMRTTVDLFHFNNWIQTSYRLNLAAQEIYATLQTKYDDANSKGDIWTDNDLFLGLMQSYMLTVAFGVENLLKGICIKNYQENCSLESLKSLSDLENAIWKNSSHDLPRLAEISKLSFSTDEMDMLKRLKAYSIWAGRYHMPKYEHEIIDLLKGNFKFQILSEDRKLISTLYSKVKQLI